MEKFAFVVLNYQSTDETVNCIDSIQKIDYEEKYIIVVDNYSNNQDEFFDCLKQKFGENNKIKYLKSTSNLGYAKGNNIGIDYAKNKIKAEYICVINPDVRIIQKDFILKSIELYKEFGYAVLGPQIINNGVNSNPLGGYHESIWRCLYSWFENHRIYFVKKYKLGRFDILKRTKEQTFSGIKHDNYTVDTSENSTYYLDKEMKLQLSGACLIFSPLFLRNFSGFCNDTFLYCEECIIACVAYNLGYKLVFSTELQTEHEGGKSLKNVVNDNDNRQMVISKAGAHSCLVVLKVILRRRNKKYLQKILNPTPDEYSEV